MADSASRGSIRRVLVANRGEIAVRVMRTCRDRGIETVAVFSDADRLAPHVLAADRALHIGPPPAAQSYLDIETILDACRDTGADALHPGYGFLSENGELADTCRERGIAFIGPDASAMRVMGSKTRARAAVMEAGAPVVPGDNGPGGRGFPDGASALDAARKIGFPVLLKASAGGGGKGMRLVAEESELEKAFDAARREAEGSFGDGTVYVERAILRPRHVEVQVFADTHGNVVHLGERDCSIQRRHQKVIEEAPSPAVDEGLRRRMGESACAIAKACNYVGAGTVEFLLEADGSYYFLEMNTRLQVEHPVTEMRYGLDLVGWQLDVAEGAPLPLSQDAIDARDRGAAMECRIYAEDPIKFLPSPGTISHLRVPNGPWVRDDSGVYEGSEISVYYDPLVSKLITWGETRGEALARMRRALEEYVVCGIETNVPLHRQVLDHPEFRVGEYDTGFLERERDRLQSPAAEGELLDVGICAAGIRLAGEAGIRVEGESDNAPGPQPIAPWRSGIRGWGRPR